MMETPDADGTIPPDEEERIARRIDQERERHSRYYEEHREEIKARAIARQKANPEAQNRYNARSYQRRKDTPTLTTAERKHARYMERREERIAAAKANYDVHRLAILDQRMRHRFGIGLDTFRRLLDAQGGGCAICGVTSNKGRRLAVDHDHRTGEVRGILCVGCNHLVGMVEHEWGDRARAYLAAPPARKVLTDPL